MQVVHKQKTFSVDDGKVAKPSDFLHAESHGIIKTKWWPYVGAMLLIDGRVRLAAFNSHSAFGLDKYLNGDLYGLELGHCVEVPYSMCPEAMLVSTAAKRGIPMMGLDMLISSFPCLPCARLCSNTGMKRLFYLSGRPWEPEIKEFRSKNIEIFRVSL
jgi:dCMP deaminase